MFTFTIDHLCNACIRGDIQFVRKIVTSKEADINDKHYTGYTPLMLAVIHNHTEIVMFLLSQSEWQTWLCYFGILRYNSLEGCWRLWIESMGSIKSIITHSPFWRINNGDHNEPSSLIERKYTEFKLSIRFLIAPLNSRQKLTTASNMVHFSMHKYQNYK